MGKDGRKDRALFTGRKKDVLHMVHGSTIEVHVVNPVNLCEPLTTRAVSKGSSFRSFRSLTSDLRWEIWRKSGKSDDFDDFDQLSAQVTGSQTMSAPETFGLGNPYGDPNWYNGARNLRETALFAQCLLSVCCKKSILFHLFYCWCSVGDWIVVIMLSS